MINSFLRKMTVPQQLQSKQSGSKELGAFYTSKPVADFLVRWAVRNTLDSVMDPSVGSGVFLEAAAERLIELGGQSKNQIFGIEVDPETLESAKIRLNESGIPPSNLHLSDFFLVEPRPENLVKVIVGNPPFIRYQRFRNEERDRALERAAECGVKLSQLSSSWAPFVIHSAAMLRKGGRLAMVLPAELAYANYAVPVLNFLVKSFGRVTLLTFKEKLFPHLSEDTLLLLASGRGEMTNEILHRDFDYVSSLANTRLSKNYSLYRTRHLNVESILDRSEKLIEYLLPAKTRDLYNELRKSALCVPLGALAKTGIGYVTGANDFFHLSPAEVKSFSIPKEFLKRAVRRGRAFNGLRFTDDDWQNAISNGDSGYLLYVNGQGLPLPAGVLEYIKSGRERGFADAYKCRVRSPWYSVPHVIQADGFLTYMSGTVPRLVVNEANAVAPNTLHVLKMRSEHFTARSLAVLWATSLSRLSAEIEGHALGGGMLKLEPREAEKTLVAAPDCQSSELDGLYSELDDRFRRGDEKAAREMVDQEILMRRLGLSSKECKMIIEGASILMNRRYRKTQ